MTEPNIKSKKLYYKIKNKFLKEEYADVIIKVEEYLNYEGIEVPPLLVYYYGYSLQKMGRLEDAYEAYKYAITLGCDDLLKSKIAYQLHDTPYINTAIVLLEELVNKPNYDNFQGYYLLGKIKLNLGIYNIALNLFEKALNFATTKEDLKRTKISIKKALRCLKNHTASLNFATYKNMGNNLLPGQIVF